MYGDTTVMRKRATQLRDQGVDIRAMADQLVAQADGIAWSGRAADTMRARVHDRAAQLRDAALAHDNAADSLTRHLGEVIHLKDAIAGIEEKVSSLVEDARARVARLEAGYADQQIRPTPSADDQQLVDFDPPQPGHKDWLSVNLPGL